MTPDRTLLAAAYLAELWPVCRELPYGERETKRAADRAVQRQVEDMAAEAEARDVPVLPGLEVADCA